MKETGKQTLFITDLDGTLLTPEKTVSIHSAEILNRLMDQGMLFSIATARSAASTVDLLRPLRITLPIVLMNGVFLYDLQKETYRRKQRKEPCRCFALTERRPSFTGWKKIVFA